MQEGRRRSRCSYHRLSSVRSELGVTVGSRCKQRSKRSSFFARRFRPEEQFFNLALLFTIPAADNDLEQIDTVQHELSRIPYTINAYQPLRGEHDLN